VPKGVDTSKIDANFRKGISDGDHAAKIIQDALGI
jgi:hypothetical protein